MNIGSLYTVKKWFWLIFPTKETAAANADCALVLVAAIDDAAAAAAAAPGATAWYSKRYNCEVSYFSPDSIVVFLEEDGIYKKFLTTDGKIGWTWFRKSASCNDCFEEVKTQ
jgi:hypothetical protein